MSALKFWVWLTEQNRLGGPARQALLEHFGSPEEVYYAEPGDLLQVEGITADQVQAWKTSPWTGRRASWRSVPGRTFSF